MQGKLLLDAFLFGFLGLGVEVAFTAALDRKRHLIGYSSLLYYPFYALVPVFFRFAGQWLFALPILARGLVYIPLCFAVEYVSMGFLRLAFGKSPSEDSYYQRRWNVHGLIRLDFAPAWFAAGLFFEFVYRVLG